MQSVQELAPEVLSSESPKRDFNPEIVGSDDFQIEYGSACLPDHHIASYARPPAETQHELMFALDEVIAKPEVWLHPNRDRVWRGIALDASNPESGVQQTITRLSTKFRTENAGPVVVNLHNFKLEGETEQVATALDGVPHRHAWGAMAVKMLEGDYLMGLGYGTPEQPAILDCWGVIRAGDKYFMSAEASHCATAITPESWSIMIRWPGEIDQSPAFDAVNVTVLNRPEIGERLGFFRNRFFSQVCAEQSLF